MFSASILCATQFIACSQMYYTLLLFKCTRLTETVSRKIPHFQICQHAAAGAASGWSPKHGFAIKHYFTESVVKRKFGPRAFDGGPMNWPAAGQLHASVLGLYLCFEDGTVKRFLSKFIKIIPRRLFSHQRGPVWGFFSCRHSQGLWVLCPRPRVVITVEGFFFGAELVEIFAWKGGFFLLGVGHFPALHEGCALRLIALKCFSWN